MHAIAPRAARPRTARVPLFSFVITALVLAGVMGGCGDDNTVGPKPNPQPSYLDSSTPFNVLYNMRIAYTARDTTAYDSLFDVNYMGTSYDPVTNNSLHFSKADEKRHVKALLLTSTVTSVSLTFPPVFNRYTDISDPSGWATVQMAGAGLGVEINDGATSYGLVSGGTMEFKFIPTTPALGSPTDTSWHIVRWSEFP
jgi:hypothetical protein